MWVIDESAADPLGFHGTYEIPEMIDIELHTVGLKHFSKAIAHRLEVIEVLAARFNNDSRVIRRICLEVMDRISATLEPELRCKLDANSKRDMSIAAYLHDIGKSGPCDAPHETQEAIVMLYSVENVMDPNQTVAETARANFSSEEAENILARAASCGIRSADTMRTFWDRHGYWTHDILEGNSEEIPIRARIIAGSHHMDRGIDPYDFSSEEYVDMLQTRILMAVDKYQAAVGRSHKTHDDAMEVIKRILGPMYGSDALMTRVLKALDDGGREETSFAEAA